MSAFDLVTFCAFAILPAVALSVALRRAPWRR
jgi:hypothetical protein